MQVFIIESLHTLGLTLLVFRVLPRHDVVVGLSLLCAVGSIPSILKLLTGQEAVKNRMCFVSVFGYFLDFLAMCGQLSIFVLLFVVDYGKKDTLSYGWVGKLDIFGG
jgi:hypothetical protein